MHVNMNILDRDNMHPGATTPEDLIAQKKEIIISLHTLTFSNSKMWMRF